MAVSPTGNVINGNTFYADTTSANGTVGSFINVKDVLIESYIISGESNSTITVSDLKYTNATYSAGDIKMILNVRANDTVPFLFDGTPVKCPNGIWITVNTGTPLLTLVVKYKG